MNAFTIGNKRGLVSFIFLLISILGIAGYLVISRQIFPELNINLNISRGEAQQRSEQWLQQAGVDTSKYIKSVQFSNNDSTITFLDKHLSSVEAGKLLNDQIPAWTYTTRFFIPSQEEEYDVSYDNLGRLSRWYHTIPETQAGTTVSVATAQTIAEEFIRTRTQVTLADYKLIETDEHQLPNRKDQNFTYERQGFSLADATQRLYVTVSADQVSSFNSSLKLPEEYRRHEAELRSRRNTVSMVGSIALSLLLTLPFFIILVLQFKKRQLLYRVALPWGILVATIVALGMVNDLPSINYYYSTLTSWSQHIAENIYGSVFGVIAAGCGTFFTLLVCEAIYREVFPNKPALKTLFTKAIWQHSSYRTALIIGTLGGIAVLLYQAAFYYFGKNFGVWSPTDSAIDQVFNGYVSWVTILLVGVLPALSEELLFRVFGISFFKKLFKKTWPGVIITTVIWASLHAAYPQEPFFIRIVELIPVGLFFSYLFLRFGLLASMTAHFTLNSVLTLQLLLKDQYVANQITASLLVALPLILYAVSLMRREPAQPELPLLTNSAVTAGIASKITRTKTEASKKYSFTSVTPDFFWLPLVLIALGIGAFIFEQSHKSPYDITLEDPISRQQALQTANQIMIQKGIDIKAYRQVIFYDTVFSETDKDYILSQSNGYQNLLKIFPQEIPAAQWNIWYFQPLQKEEYSITLNSNGSFYNYDHVLPEDRSGPSLTKEQATKKIEDYLTTEQHIKLSDYQLVDVVENKRPSRMDYNFSYKDTTYDIGEGYLETSTYLIGDEPTYYVKTLHIPEQWFRDQLQSGLKEFILATITGLFSLFLLIYGLIQILQLSRRKLMPWKKSLLWALIPAVTVIISELNNLTTYYWGYSTTETLTAYHITTIASILFKIVGAFLGSWLFITLLAGLWKTVLGNIQLPTDKPQRIALIKDSIVNGYGIAFGLGFLSTVHTYLSEWILVKYNLFDYLFDLPTVSLDINSAVPQLVYFTDILSVLVVMPLVLIPLLLLRKFLRSWWLTGLVITIIYAISIYNSLGTDPTDITIKITNAVLVLLLSVLILWLSWRNLFYLPVIIYIFTIADFIEIEGWQWLTTWQGYGIMALVALPLVLYGLMKSTSYFDRWLMKSSIPITNPITVIPKK